MTHYIVACLCLLLFTYLGYPAWLLLWRRIHSRPVRRAGHQPTVTVILSVFNEASRVVPRLENLSSQDYPHELMDIVVVCDGATDGTGEVLQALQHDWRQRQHCPVLTVIVLDNNQGKPAALSRAVEAARGECLVFADARQSFETNVVRCLMESLADPQVGAVSGTLAFARADGRSVDMGQYWALEQRIRQWQSDSGSVMGVTGANYAMRRSLYRPLPGHTLVDDLLQPILVMQAGYRVVLDARACAWDELPVAGVQESRRKVRTLTGVWQCVWPAMLLVRAGKPGLFLRFVAHKLLRLLMPWVLLLLPGLCLASGNVFWQGFAVLQLAGYAVVLLADRLTILQGLPLMGTARVFLLLNLAAARSLFHFIRGDGQILWSANEKEKRA